MPWAKFDDKTIRSRKVRRVARHEPAAALLWMFTVIYCCEQMTDGEIEGDELRELLPHHHDDFVRLLLSEKLLHDRPDCDSPDCLASQGLPLEGSDMFVVHDFLDSQMGTGEWRELRENKVYAAHCRHHLNKAKSAIVKLGKDCEHCKNRCTEDARCNAGACSRAMPNQNQT